MIRVLSYDDKYPFHLKIQVIATGQEYTYDAKNDYVISQFLKRIKRSPGRAWNYLKQKGSLVQEANELRKYIWETVFMQGLHMGMEHKPKYLDSIRGGTDMDTRKHMRSRTKPEKSRKRKDSSLNFYGSRTTEAISPSKLQSYFLNTPKLTPAETRVVKKKLIALSKKRFGNLKPAGKDGFAYFRQGGWTYTVNDKDGSTQQVFQYEVV